MSKVAHARPESGTKKVAKAKLHPFVSGGVKGRVSTTARRVKGVKATAVDKRTTEVETDLGGLLKQLRAYREADPGMLFAHKQVVAAEAEMVGKDPTDGTLVSEQLLPTSPVARRARNHG